MPQAAMGRLSECMSNLGPERLAPERTFHMRKNVITGGAGFVAVNLTRRLLSLGETVVAVDDLSRGRREALNEFSLLPTFSFEQADCSSAADMVALFGSLEGITDVWHLAANSDIPAGIEDPNIDLNRTFLTTVGILAAMRAHHIPTLHFASSSAIYGDLGMQEIVEDIGPLEPISNYGAMKLASEAQIRAAVESYLPRANIFRFPNVIGVPATHGVIMDFIAKLRATPDALQVLGDGSQQKSYLHVNDLIDAMLHISNLKGKYCVYNIGPDDEGITVREIAEIVRNYIAPEAVIQYGKGSRGWVGDVPRFRYSSKKIGATGWSPNMGSKAAVQRAVAEIALERGCGRPLE